MKISHEEYLKRKLESHKAELRELNINNRISIAKYNERREIITDEIDSILGQLEE